MNRQSADLSSAFSHNTLQALEAHNMHAERLHEFDRTEPGKDEVEKQLECQSLHSQIIGRSCSATILL